jgi:restriction system protein
MSKELWMVRAGVNGAYVQSFLEAGEVGIRFDGEQIGEIAPDTTRDEVVERYRRAFPERKEARILNAANQVYRFHTELKQGDEIVTYDPGQRRYLLGRLTGGVEYRQSEADDLPYRRKVTWTHRVPRDALKAATKNTLGSVLTLFHPNEEAAADLRSHAVPIDSPVTEQEEARPTASVDEEASLEVIQGSMDEKAREFIDDAIASLDADEMEELVAGLLRALGYRARRSAKGPDRGVDVFASPDGLGLQEPRIFAEVKHRRNTAMGPSEIRSFLGGRKPGDRCLFVSTGGFTKEAHYEAERSNIPITLVDLPMLRDLLLEHYENADNETRQLVPLTRLYWPASPES